MQSVAVLAGMDLLRRPFDAPAINAFERARRTGIDRAIDTLRDARLTHPRWSILTPLNRLFGPLTDRHPFAAPALDWGWKLTEPQTTRALAHVLSSGPAELKKARLSAFLSALGTRLEIDSFDLAGADVFAERDRIDLEIWLPSKTAGGDGAAVIIEAKFEHRLTKGQLSTYEGVRRTKRRKVPEKNIDRIVLALRPEAIERLHHKQRDKWRYRGWAATWLAYVKARPDEAREDFTIFLRAIWSAIGGFKGERVNG